MPSRRQERSDRQKEVADSVTDRADEHLLQTETTIPAGVAKRRSRRDEHSEDTRRALIEVARALFASKGYAATSTEEILAGARVARGGMYHHFSNKKHLFREVLEVVESDFIERMVEVGAPGADVWEEICDGCQAFLDLALEPEVQRIVLLDGPAVLGWRDWRDVEEKYVLGYLREFLEQAIEDGLVEPQPVDPLTHLLAGALNEASMVIANAPDRTVARAEVGAGLRRLLERLRISGLGL